MATKPKEGKAPTAFDVGKLFEIASKITNPIALLALIIVALFAICYFVLSLEIFSKIGADTTAVLLEKLLDKFSWVAELAAIVAVVAILGKCLPKVIDSFRGQTAPSTHHPSPQEGVGSHGASTGQTKVVKVGIRSFMDGTEEWEHEMNAILSVVEFFDKRMIKDAKAWQKEIFPRIQSFLREPCKKTEECHLHFRAHSSIAFAAGYCLPTRTGVTAFPVQYTPMPVLWRPTGRASGSACSGWSVNVQSTGQDVKKKKGPVDVAIGIGVVQDPRKDVREYVTKSLSKVGRIIYFIIEPAPSNLAISDGAHAKLLVDQISNFLKTERTADERQGTLHIFAAAPHAFIFLLGQLAHSFGPCVMYEYAFEPNTPGGYEPSISFPPK